MPSARRPGPALLAASLLALGILAWGLAAGRVGPSGAEGLPLPRGAAPPAGAPDLGAETLVYVSKSGGSYHRGDCSYLRSSRRALSLREAQAAYEPCARCAPPELGPGGGGGGPAPPSPSAAGKGRAAGRLSGKVVGVADGDTVRLLLEGGEEALRLDGIDCPERSQAYGRRAGDFVSELCLGARVELRVSGRDRYGRLLGELLLPSGESLNLGLVEAGLAWHYKRYSSDPALAAAEEAARAARRGLWAEPDPVPPWEWRREN